MLDSSDGGQGSPSPSGLDEVWLLRAIFDTSVDGIITIDDAGAILSANPAIERLFGYRPSDLIGQNIKLLMPAPYQDEHDAYLSNYRDTGVRKIIGIGREVAGRRRDGSIFPIELAVGETATPAGRIFTGNLRDISERAQSEKMHARLAALVESSDDAIISKTLDGIITSWNPAAERMFGYRADEAIGQPISIVIPPDRLEEGPAILERLRNAERIEHFETIRTRMDGTSLQVSLTISPILDSKGEVIGASKIVRDFTERKEIESALLKSEQRFSELLENVELIAIILDTEARVTFCNDHLTHISGWSREEIVGVEWFEKFVPVSDHRRRRELFQELKAAGKPAHSENRLYTKAGDYREIHWNTIVLRNPAGSVVGVASLGEDVTERNRATAALQEALAETERRVERRTAALAKSNAALTVARDQADAANRAKSEFLSRMSHELRTPMNSVLGYAQLLNMHFDEPRIKEATNAILGSGQHLLSMINEVLDLSRIESGDFAISPEPVPFADVLLQSLDLLRPIAHEHGIDLAIEGEVCADLHFKADRQRLLQVMINLIGNAIKYNRKGGRVIVRCADPQGGFGRIEVTDTGCGIRPNDEEMLFQPFQRFGDPGIEGTGLGLALSHRFVKMMGGNLTLACSSTEGSTFCVELQTAEAPYDRARVPAPDHSSIGRLEDRQGCVLYIEDNPSNMKLLETVLADFPSIRMIPAVQGLMGIELARQHTPDLILLDLHLPGLSGHEVLGRLKADPLTAHVPVVVLSADAMKRQIEAILDHGAADYLTKPIDLERLYAVLRQHLPVKV